MTTINRQDYIRGLEERYRPFTKVLHDKLREWRFHFVEQQHAHHRHIDERLIVRHALPYCITEETFFGLNEDDVDFLAAVMLLHSLALTKIDDYYDGGNQTKGGELQVDAIAYSLSATHEAMTQLVAVAPNGLELARMLDVTNFVHSRMYKDYTERYRPEYLDAPQSRLDTYLHSPTSRLLGSGYWEVMARAAFVQRGMAFPEYLRQLDHKLRKLRQLVDELADVEEDIRGGLVTLPILHALVNHINPGEVQREIMCIWQGGNTRRLRELLVEAQTAEWVREKAQLLHAESMRELDATIGRTDKGFRELFQYKLAKLKEIG